VLIAFYARVARYDATDNINKRLKSVSG